MRGNKRSAIRLILLGTLITGTIGAASCAPRVVDSYCLNYQPVSYSDSQDTPDTVRQIKGNNAVWKSLCQ